MRSLFKKTLFAALILISSSVSAGEWKFGAQFSYASGISDLVDQYERNLRAQGFFILDVVEIPVGIGFKSRYETPSGFFVDLNLGPVFYISGDVSHFEVPVFASVGYSFLPGSSFSPFLKAGVAYHIANGDFAESSSPGLLASAGVTFGKNWGIEAAVDDSSVEVEVLGTGGRIDGTIDINTYDVIISVFALF